METGKLRHVYMDFPLEAIHKLAFKAAEAAHCAGEQGKYWEMHDQLFASQNALEPWPRHAEAIGLDVAKFEECLGSGRQAGEIRREMAEGQRAGVSSTPTFLLGYTDPNGTRVRAVGRLTGAQSFAAFKAEIDRLLAADPEAAKDKGAGK